jgi:hypothetical protein
VQQPLDRDPRIQTASRARRPLAEAVRRAASGGVAVDYVPHAWSGGPIPIHVTMTFWADFLAMTVRDSRTVGVAT